MSSSLKRSFYLFRRQIIRQCKQYKQLQSNPDLSIEEIGQLAQLRSKLKIKLKQIQKMIKQYIVDPNITIILTLKLLITTTIEQSKIVHTLHPNQKPLKIKKYTTQLSNNKSKMNSIKTSQSKSIVKSKAQQKINQSLKQNRQSIKSSAPKPRIPPIPKSQSQVKLKQPLDLSSIQNYQYSQRQSTVITIKISKQDYYQLVQNRQSFDLSNSNLLQN